MCFCLDVLCSLEVHCLGVGVAVRGISAGVCNLIRVYSCC